MLFIRRLCILLIILLFSLSLWTPPAQASVKLNDRFRATQNCEAFQSLRKQTNPGNIKLTPDTIYPVTAKNKEDATYYHLKIDGVEPSLRWVSVNCGELLGSANVPPSTLSTLLAISWQPAFCETHQNKIECQTQTENRFDADNFTLHGLWPQPRNNVYCGVTQQIKSLDLAKKWSELPPIQLSEPLVQELAIKMPGMASDLHLHEWYKHGTCYSDTPEEYYQESLDLLNQINDSPVRDLFAANIGNQITSSDIRNEFNQTFSNNAGSKVAVSCFQDNEPTNRRMIAELKLNFQGDIEPETLMTDLFVNGKSVSSGCNRGEIDPVGFD